jgi:hypothetical protein
MRTGPMFAGVAIAAAAGIAIAQTAARHKLHEDLPSPFDRPAPVIGDRGSGNPAAFAAGDKVLPRPPADKPSPAANKGEPVLGAGGFAADRQTSMTPDGNTGPENTLHYVSVFNPDVLPFKRMSALDGVADDYTLNVTHKALVELTVGGTSDKSRDRFWGSVLIELSPGKDVALPSVAPDMRILSYEIKPSIAVRFAKDGADNFFIRSDETSAAGTYRLVFLADADAGYFAPALPTIGHLTPRMVATMAPAEIRASVPGAVTRQARRTLGLPDLAVDADTDLHVAFNRLVKFFRAFQAKTLPPSSGNLYRDLCDSKAGVCRHRAFAFMVTANALGIPTRFVENEAHAFVEVWFPGRNWQRIDLGGAALHLDVQGADNKTLHRPRTDDPFDKPPQYRQNYTQLEGDIRGLTAQQLADKRKSLNQAPASGVFDTGNAAGGLGPDRILPDQGLPTVTRDPRKRSPKLSVTTADDHAFRGDQLHVEGRAYIGDKGLPDHPVDVFLSPAGRGGSGSILLGRTITNPDGTFRDDFPIPAAINLANYDIWLSSPEDAYYNAALSEQ